MEGATVPGSSVRTNQCVEPRFEIGRDGPGYLSIHALDGELPIEFSVSAGDGIFLDFNGEVGLIGIEFTNPSDELLLFFGYDQ